MHVAGLLTTRAELGCIELSAQPPVLVARGPDESIATPMVLDPTKVVVGHITAPSPVSGSSCIPNPARDSGSRPKSAPRGEPSTPGPSPMATTQRTPESRRSGTSTRPLRTPSRACPKNFPRGILRTLLVGLYARSQDPTRLTIAFASCQLPTDERSPSLWKREANRPPAHMTPLLGDQI